MLKFTEEDLKEHPEFEHVGLVYSIAKKIYKKRKKCTNGLDIDDLVSVGLMSLIKCSKGFDPSKGKFTTYSYKVIYRDMEREINKLNFIHIPVEMIEHVSRVQKNNTYEELDGMGDKYKERFFQAEKILQGDKNILDNKCINQFTTNNYTFHHSNKNENDFKIYLNNLDEIEKSVFEEYIFNNKTLKDISKEKKCTYSHIWSIYNRGREKIKKMIGEEYNGYRTSNSSSKKSHQKNRGVLSL